MDTKQLYEELSVLILRTSLKGKYALLDIAESHGITLMQGFALCLLEPNQPVPMNSIASFLMCDASNVTGIVDRLVAGSFIERKESEKDRRVKTITLTKEGIELRKIILAAATESRLPHLDTMSSTELQKLVDLLKKASGN